MKKAFRILWNLFAFFLWYVLLCIIGAIVYRNIHPGTEQVPEPWSSYIRYGALAGAVFISITGTLVRNIKRKSVNSKKTASTISRKLKTTISPEDQAVIDNFSKSVDAMLSTPKKKITPEEYAEIRQAERDWLEAYYDFSTVESVNAIPERKDLPRPPGKSVTGDVYYHLHYRARLYADELKYDLAIACQRKSNALIKFRYGNWSGRKECYYLVKLYARAGMLSEAYAEKDRIECFYGIPEVGTRDHTYSQSMIQLAIKQGKDERDFQWLQSNLPSLCPKSKNGFCRMRSQNTANYQKLKQMAASLGKEI